MIKTFVCLLAGYGFASYQPTTPTPAAPAIEVAAPPAPAPAPAPSRPRPKAHAGHAELYLGNGASISVTLDPKLRVRVRWEREMPAQIAEVIASLGEPTSGACWNSCVWGDRASLIVHKTRTINWTSFEWNAP